MTEQQPVAQSLSENEQTFKLKNFTALSLHELMQIFQLRQQVFIIEQDCPYPDIDDVDLTAWHLFHSSKQGIDAYARIILNNQKYTSIGRVVVAWEKRHLGLGQSLMKAAIGFCRDHERSKDILISAQSYLAHFYRNLGFVETGHFYLEDDLPHMKMVLKAQS